MAKLHSNGKQTHEYFQESCDIDPTVGCIELVVSITSLCDSEVTCW